MDCYRSLEVRLADLLDWFARNDVWLDPRLEIRWSSEYEGWGIFATSSISRYEIISHLPKPSTLSIRTTSISDRLVPLRGLHPPILLLAVALLHEMRLGKASRWSGYIRSLPCGQIPLAVFWRGNAQEWAQGTEVQRGLLERENSEVGGRSSRAAVVEFYYRVAQPILQSVAPELPPPELCEFERAYSLVSSRAFSIDNYHGAAMVPLADLYNHVEENNVHFESDDYVCPQCGSLSSCPHDSPSSSPTSDASSSMLPPDTVDIVCYEQLQPGDEAFNSYGEDIPNARLALDYGFILEANSADKVSVGPSGEVPDAHQLHGRSGELLCEGRGAWVDADGRISQGLWTRAAGRAGLDASIWQAILDVQEALVGGDPAPTLGEALRARMHALGVLCLLRERRSEYRQPERTDMWDLIEAARETDLRMALMISVDERRILDVCIERWDEVVLNTEKLANCPLK